MSMIFQCDLCGKKQNKKIKFTEKSLKIQLPAYNKENLNFYMNITVENDNDSKEMLIFQNKMASFGVFSIDDMADVDAETVLLIKELEDEISEKLTTIHPNICNNCKREVLKLALRYGSFIKLSNPIKD